MPASLKLYRCCLQLLLAAPVFFYSCKKNDPGARNSFTWEHTGNSHSTTLDTAYIAHPSRHPYTLVNKEKRPGYTIYRRVEFNLTSFSKGSYTINDGNGAYNRLAYVDDADTVHIGVFGTIQITASNNQFISGTFSARLIKGSGVQSDLTGQFTNVPVR